MFKDGVFKLSVVCISSDFFIASGVGMKDTMWKARTFIIIPNTLLKAYYLWTVFITDRMSTIPEQFPTSLYLRGISLRPDKIYSFLP